MPCFLINGLKIYATLKEVGTWLCFIDTFIMDVIAGNNSTKHSFKSQVGIADFICEMRAKALGEFI